MGHQVKLVLSIVQVKKSTYYYQLKNKDKIKTYNGGRPIPGYSYTKNGDKISDSQIKIWLLQFIENEGFSYGYLKLTIALKKYKNLIINKKKVYRLCNELDILRPQRIIKPKHPKKIARNRTVTGSNQLWQVDIKYGYIAGEDRFFFVLSYIDVFDRSIVDYHMGLSCTADDAVNTLKRALWHRNLYDKDKNLIIRSDNGPQFISNTFQNACMEYKIEHERIPFKSPNMNAYIESYHSILERECFSVYEFRSYAEAYEEVARFVKFYNSRRIHGSIHWLSPEEYYQGVLNKTIKGIEITA